jgi:hypothetical protein
LQRFDVDLDGGEGLSNLVVKLAGYVAALGLLDFKQPVGAGRHGCLTYYFFAHVAGNTQEAIVHVEGNTRIKLADPKSSGTYAKRLGEQLFGGTFHRQPVMRLLCRSSSSLLRV